MNLYEWEGKKIFKKFGIAVPKSVLVRRGDDIKNIYQKLGIREVVVKAQILSGKRGKNNGIYFCSTADEVEWAVKTLFATTIKNQYVAAVLIEEKLQIAAEHYLSITYDTVKKVPVLIYSKVGGMDIEDVPDKEIHKEWLDVRKSEISFADIPYAAELWNCFLTEDTRLVEINPLVLTQDGKYLAADAKVALDEGAFFRHEDWKELEHRTMLGRLPTEREIAVKKIDEGKDYYRGTAGQYIELDGDIAVLFSGGGASISSMDSLIQAGLKPANYTEYSGNPPREKVYQLAKIALSKPGLKGLWIAGGVANFTNIAETFNGITDALDELKPSFPIVIRRAGPFEEEGIRLMKECAERNGLRMKIFGKETSIGDTARPLFEMVNKAEAVIV